MGKFRGFRPRFERLEKRSSVTWKVAEIIKFSRKETRKKEKEENETKGKGKGERIERREGKEWKERKKGDKNGKEWSSIQGKKKKV